MRMMRGPYCDGPMPIGRNGGVVRCGQEVAPREAKYFRCDNCASHAPDRLAAELQLAVMLLREWARKDDGGPARAFFRDHQEAGS